MYLDDIIVLGLNITHMLEPLSQVFTRLQADLKLKPSKVLPVSYLGHIVSAKGVTTSPQKGQRVIEWR